MTPTDTQTDAFYRCAALGLAWLDARESSPRRFGAAADAAWRNYAGSATPLTDVDRVELLLRDAATLHPDAFGPRAVFALDGLTDDEPFGQWLQTPAPGVARDVLRASLTPAGNVRALLEAAAKVWSVPLGSTPSLPVIGPTTRVLCVGAGAFIALAAHFESNRTLALHEQVAVVTDSPAVRQIVGLAGLALGERSAARVLASDLPVGALRALGIIWVDALVSSDDASTAERTSAEAWLVALKR